MTKPKQKTCPECGGAGTIADRQLGEEIRMLRVAAKVSVRKLAARLDVQHSYISRAERGDVPWPMGRTAEILQAIRELAAVNP